MGLEFLNEYVILIVLAISMGIGYIIKTSMDFIPNKYIPLIMGCIGIAFNIYANAWAITPEIIAGGLISGLASTGMYELFRNFINKVYQE